MNLTTTHLTVATALVVDVAYGIMVYVTNPRRTTNQQFLVLTLILGGWMACVWNVLIATTEGTAEIWLRVAFMISQLVPTAFLFMLTAITRPELTAWQGIYRARRLLLINLAIAVMCMTDSFIRGVSLPGPEADVMAVAEPLYGPGFAVFNLYYVGILGWLITRYVRAARRARGFQQAELHFILLACGACIATGISLALIIPALLGTSRTAPLAPLCAIVLNAIIAYGIARRRILGVAHLLRRATASALLTLYLSLLYVAVQWAARHLINIVTPDADYLAQLLATLVVAFSLAPANGHLQRLAQRLFINEQVPDVGDILRRVTRTLQSITTLEDLLRQFSSLVATELRAERAVVLLEQETEFVETAHGESDEPPLRLHKTFAIPRALRLQPHPLMKESLKRRQLPPLLSSAVTALDDLNLDAAFGVYIKEHLSAIVLIGPRPSGRLYSANEEDALQIICGELAVAMENARLFTETRDGQIYNDILLDNLGSGVVSINQQGEIVVFNRDAQRILRRPAEDVIGKTCDILPEPLPKILHETLATGLQRQDDDVAIKSGDDNERFVRVGGSVFHGHRGDTLGALVVFHDVTHLKTLQAQVRRSDRLASMGTLSAGMAHEIKNPLVTIKTFTQLLPERYHDPEFRDSFVSLVGVEAKRIDSLVNQLLTFARPSKPSFKPVHMHEVIDDSLRLVAQQLEHNHIITTRDYRCADDLVQGDADLLSQAYVNFFLNANDAMPSGGTLRIATSRVQNSRQTRPRASLGSRASAMLIRIEDTGSGIREEDLIRVFDPFFTTKAKGTGLGLAVAHGIIEEQRGAIDVQSQLGVGTTFLITFPVHGDGVPA